MRLLVLGLFIANFGFEAFASDLNLESAHKRRVEYIGSNSGDRCSERGQPGDDRLLLVQVLSNYVGVGQNVIKSVEWAGQSLDKVDNVYQNRMNLEVWILGEEAIQKRSDSSQKSIELIHTGSISGRLMNCHWFSNVNQIQPFIAHIFASGSKAQVYGRNTKGMTLCLGGWNQDLSYDQIEVDGGFREIGVYFVDRVISNYAGYGRVERGEEAKVCTLKNKYGRAKSVIAHLSLDPSP